jgi:5'(3')-deoxyribonucleotidase
MKYESHSDFAKQLQRENNTTNRVTTSDYLAISISSMIIIPAMNIILAAAAYMIIYKTFHHFCCKGERIMFTAHHSHNHTKAVLAPVIIL